MKKAKAKLEAAERESNLKSLSGVNLKKEIERLKQENDHKSIKMDKSMNDMTSHLKSCHNRVRDLEGNLQV